MTLSTFLNTLSPMRRAKAEAALTMPVRLNGATRLTPRHAIIETRIATGATLSEWRGQPVLKTPEGAFLDASNITKTGLDYAGFLLATP